VLTVHPNEGVVAQWRQMVEAGWGTGTHSHTLAMVESLVIDLLEGTCEPEAALGEIGRRCATDGHELADVSGWLTILVGLSPRRIRNRLQSRSCAEALASGWVHAALDIRPPFRRLAPVAVLHMRLRELADQCNALGMDLVQHYVFVVLDADTGALGPGARASVMRQVAEAALRTFRSGETIAATDSGRIIVLGPRSRDLPSMVQTLVAEVQDRPQVAGHRVGGWIEPLPREAVYHDSLIDELAR
jgi:hypothetical protein